MIIVTIRSDKPEAELGLYDDKRRLAYVTWPAHRELANTLHQKLLELLQSQGKSWPDIQGIVAFKGPGSFTGLRIGLTVANALAYSNGIPVVASKNSQTVDDSWITQGISRLLAGESDAVAMPEYGAEANITKPKR